MAITIKSLGGGRGCCGPSRGVSGLGDAVMTLEGFRGIRGLGLTADDLRPRTAEVVDSQYFSTYHKLIVPTYQTLTYQPMIASEPDASGTVLLIGDPPPPAPSESGFPSTLAPTDGVLPPGPEQPPADAFVPQPPPIAPAAPAADAGKIKVALAIGGTVMIAALIMRGGR